MEYVPQDPEILIGVSLGPALGLCNIPQVWPLRLGFERTHEPQPFAPSRAQFAGAGSTFASPLPSPESVLTAIIPREDLREWALWGRIR